MGAPSDIHHVTLVVLVVTQRQQDDVALVDPDLLAKLAADVAESAGAVEALRLQAAISGEMSAHTSPATLCWGEASGCFVPDLGGREAGGRRQLTYPSIFTTCAYSWPSSLKVSSRFSLSFSFFPRLRFLPPFPLFLGILPACEGYYARGWYGLHLVLVRTGTGWTTRGCLCCGEMQEEGVAASNRQRVCVGGVLLCLWAFTAGRTQALGSRCGPGLWVPN